MKKYVFILLCAILCACKKDNTRPANCDLLQERTTQYGTSRYEYDAQGRITKSIYMNGDVTTTYAYPDKYTVQTTDKNAVQTITLNERNQVIVRDIRYSNGQRMKELYELDEDGWPIRMKVEEFLAGEAQTHRMSTYEVEYTVADGNLYKFSYRDMATNQRQVFEYTYDLSRLNNKPVAVSYIETNPLQDNFNRSRNIPSSVRAYGVLNGNETFSYEFDAKGRMSRQINKSPGDQSVKSVTEFTYTCN